MHRIPDAVSPGPSPMLGRGLSFDAPYASHLPSGRPCPAGSGAISDAARPVGSAVPISSEALPNVLGKRVTIVRVTYAPGGYTPSHRHAGSVIAYVTAGTIRSQQSGRVHRLNAARRRPVSLEDTGSLSQVENNVVTKTCILALPRWSRRAINRTRSRRAPPSRTPAGESPRLSRRICRYG